MVNVRIFILKIAEHRADVGSIVGAFQFELLGLGEICAQVPLRENALRLGKAVGIEDFANLFAQANRIIRISRTVGISVPGIKI
jgi:hypothetical protein